MNLPLPPRCQCWPQTTPPLYRMSIPLRMYYYFFRPKYPYMKVKFDPWNNYLLIFPYIIIKYTFTKNFGKLQSSSTTNRYIPKLYINSQTYLIFAPWFSKPISLYHDRYMHAYNQLIELCPTLSTERYWMNMTRLVEIGGKVRRRRVVITAPSRPSSGGVKDQLEQMPGIGGIISPWTCAKNHLA